MTGTMRGYSGITYIYGLVDPRTNQLRYVGKTILKPARRLVTHQWQARKAKHKRHVLAWLASLEADGVAPELVEIEHVAAFGDWEEAERFWIEYFRSIGADLCNLTVGGDGAPGAKMSEENKAKRRLLCGPLSPLYRVPKPAHVHVALRLGGEKLRADPARRAIAEANRKAGLTPDILAAASARLVAIRSDPERNARREARRLAKCRTVEHRARVGRQTSKLWATKREEIIAAQNAGKGEEYRRKQSLSGSQKWTNPGNRYWDVFLTPAKRAEIREHLRRGMKGVEAAKKFGLSQSRISQIKQGA